MSKSITLILFLILSPSISLTSNNKFLAISEHEIDLGIIAFTLTKELNPNINKYSKNLDILAQKIRQLNKGSTDPDHRIRCLNTVIHQHQGFKANRDNSFLRAAKYYDLSYVLDSKVGNCFSLPLLYVAVGQRLGWPIHLVHVPDHSFVRYVDPKLKEQNIEATSGGGYVPNHQYTRDFKISSKGRKNGSYLRTLSYRETVADLLGIHAVNVGQKGHIKEAISYLEAAIKINPELVSAWANLVNANKIMARQSKGLTKKKYLEDADKYEKKLEELGFVHPKDVPQLTLAQ